MDTAAPIRTSPTHLSADPRLVVAKPFTPGGGERIRKILGRLACLSDGEVAAELEAALRRHRHRHRDITRIWQQQAEAVLTLFADRELSEEHRTLVGALFTQEVAYAAAALTNPSAVPIGDPDEDGGQRFVMSVRAIGEGHVSSIGFREGYVDATGDVDLEVGSVWAETGRIVYGDGGRYRVEFGEIPLDERLLAPATAAEAGGMEDARFVRFRDEAGERYLATYTAYDRSRAVSHLVETEDFTTFQISPLTGRVAKHKGIALFPRPVGGQYLALGRMDNESTFLCRSDNLHRWDDAELLNTPTEAWELIQGGNCGSPIETEGGWLVITHGVGAMRRYVLGAILLDLDDPGKVIGRLTRPLLEPTEAERDGYVPNIVYSCGGFTHNNTLVLPYGVADRGVRIASIDLDWLLGQIA